MKIIGIMSWFDEAPHWLATAVTGFARLCDQIIAVDGAYGLYPGGRPCSHPQQAEAILSSAEAAGVSLTLHRPHKLFMGNEVEKRNLTLRLAAAYAEIGDWLMVFDADCHLFKVNEEVVRWELENTQSELASYTFLTVEDMFSDPELAKIVRDDDYTVESTGRTRDIYRWHPTLMYGPQHWVVSREYELAGGGVERRWLRHSRYGEDNVLDLEGSLVVYHRSNDRAMVRRMAQSGYYQARDLYKIEDMKAGQPADNGVGVRE